MKRIFADTSFYLAILFADDSLHARAVRWRTATDQPLITTEFVLVELVDAMSAEHLRDLAVSAIETLRDDPLVQIVPVSTELFDAGLDLFSQRRDKRWSLTDCISFVVMTRNDVREALTADHHFEQAGFVALLR